MIHEDEEIIDDHEADEQDHLGQILVTALGADAHQYIANQYSQGHCQQWPYYQDQDESDEFTPVKSGLYDPGSHARGTKGQFQNVVIAQYDQHATDHHVGCRYRHKDRARCRLL